MRNRLKHRVAGKWLAAFGRVILALAFFVIGCGATIADAAANLPVMTGKTPTMDTTPTWSWSTGGGGNGQYRYKLDNSNLATGALATTSTEYTPTDPLAEGKHVLYVQESDATGVWSASGKKVVLVDLTGPGAPVVDGTSPSTDTTPTWSCISGGGGNSWYRYKFDNSDLTVGAKTTKSTSFTPTRQLADGSHTLYVQERDAAGNWSETGSRAIVVDGPPKAPKVMGKTPTMDTTPTWHWTPGGDGNGTYRCKLDNNDLATGATETTLTTFTPVGVLTEGCHTLYVQEQDRNGSWSASGQRTIIVDITPPDAPVVSGASPTSDTTPTWNWISSGGGNGTYRYRLDSSKLWIGATITTLTEYTSDNGLTVGKHTLYVQERDGAGNWSAYGTKEIFVSLLPDTGQTQSYTSTFGEDSDYTINPPSYTVHSNGTVTDNVTGLMWQQQGSAGTWDGAIAYCQNLELAGYSDYRLPSKKELVGIVIYGTWSPAIDTAAFPYTSTSYYWSSTTAAFNNASYAWYVDFDYGDVSTYHKWTILYVRCVRGVQ